MLSIWMTARIQDAGTEKRLAAWSMNDCHETASSADGVDAGSAWAETGNEVTTEAAAMMPRRPRRRGASVITSVAETDGSSSDGRCRRRVPDGTSWRGSGVRRTDHRSRAAPPERSCGRRGVASASRRPPHFRSARGKHETPDRWTAPGRKPRHRRSAPSTFQEMGSRGRPQDGRRDIVPAMARKSSVLAGRTSSCWGRALFSVARALPIGMTGLTTR